MSRDFHSQSPSGAFAIEVIAWEAAMSLWVESPVLVNRVTGTDLLRFKDINWSLDKATWMEDGKVRLLMRKYPGNHTPTEIEVVVDCDARTARVGTQEAHSLLELEDAMTRAIRPDTGKA